MGKRYWQRAHERAMREARAALSLESPERAVIAVVLAAAAIAGIWLIRGASDAWSELIAKIATTAAVVIAFPLVYGWKLTRAPVAMENDLLATHKLETDALNKALEVSAPNLQKQRMLVLTLSVLWERGRDLLNRRIKEDQFGEWQQDQDKWARTTLRLLATEFSHQEAVAFKSVLIEGSRNFVYKVHEDHNKALRGLLAHLKTLEAIVDRHKEHWAPVTEDERKGIEARLKVFEIKALAEKEHDKELSHER